MSASRCRVDGVECGVMDVRDRGLCYGDGLFETCLCLEGRAPLWQRHARRLLDGCARLSMPVPDIAQLAREVAAVCEGLPRAVVRITCTRGTGLRGYSAQGAGPLRSIVTAAPAPVIDAARYRDGVCVRWCELRLAEQPRLAGIKHLNRLEQVLARAEWNDPRIAEGLLRDAAGRVIGATAANLFAVIDGTLVTPAVERCGVAGVMRAQVLDWSPCAQMGIVSEHELMRASEVFLTNAVRGVCPVRALAGREWPVGPQARSLIARVAALGITPGVAA